MVIEMNAPASSGSEQVHGVTDSPNDGAAPAAVGKPHAAARHPSLSPSRAQDFQRCPLLFRFRVVDRLPEPQSAAAAKGTLVHSVLEHLFTLPAAGRTLANALKRLPEAWETMRQAKPGIMDLFADEAEQQTWYSEAEHLLRVYFTLEDPRRLAPEGQELLVDAELPGGLHLRGYIDRLDVAPGSGALRIVDYKTGKLPREPFRDKALFQLKCYALALWRIRGVVPAMLQLEYLGSGEMLRYEPHQRDLEATEATLIALWSAIERTARSGNWPAVSGPLCPWCAHQDICPAFGNEPPLPPADVTARLGLAEG